MRKISHTNPLVQRWRQALLWCALVLSTWGVSAATEGVQGSESLSELSWGFSEVTAGPGLTITSGDNQTVTVESVSNFSSCL